jgi:hypothetical protein
MPQPVLLDRRERQTTVAALRYWRDEMCPHPDIQGFYFEDPNVVPLNEDEIEGLCQRLITASDGD